MLVMAKQKNTRLEKHQLEAISDMVDRGLADNESEAHRMLLNEGKRAYGYKNGGYSDTALKQACGKLARAFLLIGVVLIGVTYFYPITFRILAVGPILSGLFLLGVESLLESHEPKVSNRIKRLFGGEAA
jgi:hypothetical protein